MCFKYFAEWRLKIPNLFFFAIGIKNVHVYPLKQITKRTDLLSQSPSMKYTWKHRFSAGIKHYYRHSYQLNEATSFHRCWKSGSKFSINICRISYTRHIKACCSLFSREIKNPMELAPQAVDVCAVLKVNMSDTLCSRDSYISEVCAITSLHMWFRKQLRTL